MANENRLHTFFTEHPFNKVARNVGFCIDFIIGCKYAKTRLLRIVENNNLRRDVVFRQLYNELAHHPRRENLLPIYINPNIQPQDQESIGEIIIYDQFSRQISQYDPSLLDTKIESMPTRIKVGLLKLSEKGIIPVVIFDNWDSLSPELREIVEWSILNDLCKFQSEHINGIVVLGQNEKSKQNVNANFTKNSYECQLSSLFPNEK